MLRSITKSLILHAEIYAAPAAIYALLAHPRSVQRLHPYLEAIMDVREGVTADQQIVYEYLAVERVPLWGVTTLTNHIQAHMILAEPPLRWVQVGKARFGIQVAQTITLAAHNALTHVTNQLAYTAPRWLSGYVGREVATAHQRFMSMLQKLAEGNSP
jgi:hypothetical protein